MKKLSILIVFLVSSIMFAQETKGPYLEVLTENAVIPLKETKADVQISGTIAHVTLTQVYQNKGNQTIEAKYVFPMSTQAAVHDMTMTIGGRKTKAIVYEKQEAQRVYNTAISEGKRAAKLDQERPNVFQMNVGNIMAGDVVEIQIFYTEMLVPELGKYEFVLPGVVGPRFTGEDTSTASTFNSPYTGKGISESFDYDIKVCLNAGMMIQDISSNSHQIEVSHTNSVSADVRLSESNENPANRDFILSYSLRGNEIQTGMLLYEHNGENYFAYMMEPPLKAKLKQIPPREYLFVVDVSGSMNGYPLEVSKKLMRNLLGNLREIDSFNILLFASSSETLSATPLSVTPENIENGINFLSSRRGGGGTRLLNALNTAYSLPRTSDASARSMVVITDGYISVEKEAFNIIENNLDKASVFTFGIGSSVNRYLIEGMAKISNSESFIATSTNEAYQTAEKFKKYIEQPVLTQIKLKTKGFEVYDIEPKSIPDVYATRPIVVYGKYRGEPKGKLIITGYEGSGRFKEDFDVSKAVLSNDNKALRYLWARKRIERLDDYKKAFRADVKEEVTALGLQYNLATQYTSFVAVDNEVVNKGGKQKTLKQPLPMPKNVNNSAVGAEAEVKVSTKYKQSFKLIFEEGTGLTRSEQRQIKMWFKTNYSETIQKLLAKHKNFRIQWDAKRGVYSVETIENGVWLTNDKLTAEFQAVTATGSIHATNFTLTIKK